VPTEVGTAPGHVLPHALRDGLPTRVAGRPLALFLDYDGTLCPIVTRPEDAVLDEAMRHTLQGLIERHVTAVVSGRELNDLRRRVDLPGLHYAGNHGFEIEGASPALRCEVGGEFVDEIGSAAATLRRLAGRIEGALVEHKRYSVSVHFRLVPSDQVKAVEVAVTQTLADHPRLRLNAGKKLFELRPALDWHKGKATRWLLDRLSEERSDLLPIFIGDDVTDEDAFRELSDDGIGILVSDTVRSTSARYWLRDVDEVRQLLAALSAR